jgi:amidase
MLQRGALSSAELVAAHLDRIDALDATYGALVSRRPREEALVEASARDAELADGTRRGWMHGLPFAVKDLVDARGLPTTQGFFPVREAPIAVEDEPFVGRIRAAGAVVVGKTNAPEFGLGSHTYNAIAPATRNVADPRRSAGGSSGGAAVAVAAGLVPVADGSDFMGSLRNPPGWNGVLGLRPTPGLVLGAGVDPRDPGFAVDGPIARTVADLAALMGTMAEPGAAMAIDEPDRHRRPRVGWLGDLDGHLPFEEEILDICHSAAERWSPSLTSVRLPPSGAFGSVELLWPTWLTTRHDAVGRWLVDTFTADEIARMKPEAQWEIEGFRHLSPADRTGAQRVRADLRRSAEQLLSELDVLVLPTAQVWPFAVEQHWPARIGEVAMDTYHRWMEVTVFATLAGLPTLAVPAGMNGEGLHMGLQVIGRPHSERALLGWASLAEKRGCFTVAAPSSAAGRPPALR